MSEYTIKTVSGSVVGFDDAGDGLPLTKCEVNIAPKVEIGTVSGSIVAFSDGSEDTPLKNCEVTIAPTLDGVSSVNVVQTGKNLVDDNMYQDGNNRVVLAINVYLKSGTYTISLDIETPRNFYYRKHDSGSWTNLGGYNKKVVTFTISEDDNYDFSYYVSTGILVSEISNLMLEVGSSQTIFEPYETPTTHTINLGRTIYGGEIDVMNGTGTDYGLWANLSDIAWAEDPNRAGVFYGSVSGRKTASSASPSDVLGCTCYEVYNSGVSTSKDKYISGYWSYGGGYIFFRDSALAGYTRAQVQQALQGEKVCVVSANQTDFTFTPVPINSYLGNNTMWSDGDLSVEYYKKGYNTKTVNVVQTGKNLLNTHVFNGLQYYTVNSDGSVTVNSSDGRAWANISTATPIKAGTYTLSRTKTGSVCDIRFASENYATAHSIYSARTELEFTLTEDTYYKIKVGTSGTYPFTDFYQLEVGSSASSYTPYVASTTYTASLGLTIYGGTADVSSGKGNTTHGNIVFDGTETWSYGTNENDKARVWIKINDAKAASTNLASNGILPDTTKSSYPAVGYGWINANSQLIIGVDETTITSHTAWETYLSNNNLAVNYELATPVPFTFTPINLTSNSSNTLWSTEGDITVSYYSYIETDGRYLISGSTLTDIADAIREKTLIVGPINVNDFVTDIMTIDNAAPDAEEVEF